MAIFPIAGRRHFQPEMLPSAIISSAGFWANYHNLNLKKFWEYHSSRAGSPQSSSGQAGLPGHFEVAEYLPKSLGLHAKLRSDRKRNVKLCRTYINALGVMHNAVILPERATRCRYRPRAWVLVRLAWPGSAAQGKPRRRQARQAVALRRPGKARKVSPGFEKYCTYMISLSKNETNGSIEIRISIRITHPYPDFNDGSVKPLLNLWHGQ